MGSFASWSWSLGAALALHVLALAAVQSWTEGGTTADPRLHALVPVRIVWSAAAPAGPAAPGAPVLAVAPAVAPEAPARRDPAPKPRNEDARQPPRARVVPRPPAPPPVAPKADATDGEVARKASAAADTADGAASTSASAAAAASVQGGATGADATSGGAPWALTAVARRPEVVERVLPAYPARARALELEGQVVLEVVLDREGRPEPGMRVLRSEPAFDAAALDAVRRWRFRPARDAAGRPVRVLMEIPVRFELR